MFAYNENKRSLFNLDMEKAEQEWCFWLEQQGIPTTKTTMFAGYTHKSPAATYFRIIHSNFLVLANPRDEWEKDRWDVRILHTKYGIYYSKSLTAHYLDFTKIELMKIRDSTKNISSNVYWGDMIFRLLQQKLT